MTSDSRLLLHRPDSEPASGVVPAPYYREQARQFVETNKDRYTDLLIEQFACALNNEAREAIAAGHMREVCTALFRMLKRAGKLKAQTDDERALLAIAEGMFEFPATLPAGNRRVGSPVLKGDEYTQDVAAVVQASLFDQEAA